MASIGVTKERLEQIELRLIGADHRPWVLNRRVHDENGRALICKSSRSANRKAINASMKWEDGFGLHPDDAAQGVVPSIGPQPNAYDPRVLVQHLALFKMCSEATDDMAEFVANAPQDIEDLLEEVKRLRAKLRDVEKDRDDMKKEMLSAQVERTAVAEKLSDIRRAMKVFGAALKECQ
jgi:hypothetical protein